ncbi:MAG: hypothetical protein QM601_08000 [Pseudoxanthomonas sp.]
MKKYATLTCALLAALSFNAMGAASGQQQTASAQAGAPAHDAGFHTALQACGAEQGLTSMPKPGEAPKPGEKQPDMDKLVACMTAKGYPPPPKDGNGDKK